MKKPQKESAKFRISKTRLLAVSLSVGGLLIVGQLVFDVLLVRHVDSPDTTQVVSLIIASVENLSKVAPVDPRTGNVYFPEARLVVPMSTSSAVLRYSYIPASGNFPEELMVNNQVSVRAAESR